MFAVFPGASSARAAARRLASKLPGATTREADGGEALVEAVRGERRIAITCPPSTAYAVELYERDVLVGDAVIDDDAEAVALAEGWLEGTPVAALVRGTAKLRVPAPS